MSDINYHSAGVDRSAADRLVEKIGLLARSTLNRRVKASIGGYASLYEIDKKRWLAASTDGVGTKLKLAILAQDHSTIGIDLVAMSVNDLLCVGAEPLFFLDYYATGKLDLKVSEEILSGIVVGCKQARCALVGGETAEMPDVYGSGDYDLAGFAVGMVDPKKVLPRREVRPGDVLLGIGSSGLHSNGYSLARKLFERSGSDPRILKSLLEPTRIYVKALQRVLSEVVGLAHITGSGFLNIPRISDRVSYEIELPTTRPEVYEWLTQESGLALNELAQTFNMGIGMVIAVRPALAQNVLRHIIRSGEKAWVAGTVVKKRKSKGSEVFVRLGTENAILDYSA